MNCGWREQPRPDEINEWDGLCPALVDTLNKGIKILPIAQHCLIGQEESHPGPDHQASLSADLHCQQSIHTFDPNLYKSQNY